MPSRAGLTVVTEATYGAKALSEYQAFEPDVVFLDIHLPVMTGLDAAAKQSHTGPDDSDQLNMILRQLTAQIKPGAPHLQWIKASVGQTVRLIPIGDVFYFPSDENTHALCLKMVKC